jgi:hypothetical protein
MRKLAVLSAMALIGLGSLAASTDAEARSRRNTGAVVRTYDDYDYVPAPAYRTTRVVRYAAPVTYDYGYAPARYGYSWGGPAYGYYGW